MLIKLQTKEINAFPPNVKQFLKSLVNLFVHTQRLGTIRDLLLRCYFSDIFWSSIVCFCVLNMTATSQNVSCFYLWKRDLILKMNKIHNNQDAERMEAILTSRQSFERRQTGWGPSLCQAEAHECNLFLLEGPRVFLDYRGEKKKGKWGGLRCHLGFRWQVFCRFVLRQTDRKVTWVSVPSNVLENSLTLRSVALHHPTVASGARPRTETPLREAAESLESRDTAIPKHTQPKWSNQ